MSLTKRNDSWSRFTDWFADYWFALLLLVLAASCVAGSCRVTISINGAQTEAKR